jgi:NAD(P)-dependent dehydrogenase (short-subunit alcohol dehydrogenase family)/putative sterol carrier protein
VVVNDLGGASDGSGGSAGPADKVTEEIKALGGDAVASYDSVATPEGGQAIVNKALDTFGRLDILINNAGILRDKTLVKMEPDEWDAVLSVHLDGAYNVSRPAFLAMRETGFGRIIVTTSAAGLHGNFGQSNYSAAKSALIGFMNTLKLEGEKYNIKVNAIAPIAATRLTEDILPPDLMEKLKPEFVTLLVIYLCSEQCPVSGAIYNAGMGYYSRAAVVTASAIVPVEGEKIPTPEELASDMDRILSLEGAGETRDVTGALGDMLNALSSPGRDRPAESKSGLTVQGVFDRITDAFQPDNAAGVDVVFQFRITGPDGGDWFVTVKDGACESKKGTHEKPTTTISMADDDFVSMIGGTLNAMQAYTSGKLKISGDLMKSQLIEKLFKF